MRIGLLLLLALLPDERALRYYERTRFEDADPRDDAARRVADVLLKKEHWVGAYAELAERLGPFPDDLEVSVDFRFEGQQAAQAMGKRGKGAISFNLRRLAEAQRKIDELDAQRKAAEARGQRLTFKVPPMKFDRVIYHELTHVLQQNYDAPLWFLEGMAQLVGNDPNVLFAFALEKKPIRDIDAPTPDRNEPYARGQLFWMWLESRYATRKAVELAIYKRLPWKDALEEATQQSWVSIVNSEREWSEKQIEKYR